MTAESKVFFCAKFLTLFLRELRSAFLAERVIGMPGMLAQSLILIKLCGSGDSVLVFKYDRSMIMSVSGTVVHLDETFAVIETKGVGYKIFATGTTLGKLKENVGTVLWTHLAVRENAHDLYGFPTPEELKFFELLISVSGIGPKTALNILNIVSIETLREAVLTENIAHLVKVSGIGRKNAEKIVLELRDKFERGEEGSESLRDESDAIEALTSLGYSQKEAREALKEVPKDISGTSERVRYALKLLSRS